MIRLKTLILEQKRFWTTAYDYDAEGHDTIAFYATADSEEEAKKILRSSGGNRPWAREIPVSNMKVEGRRSKLDLDDAKLRVKEAAERLKVAEKAYKSFTEASRKMK